VTRLATLLAIVLGLPNFASADWPQFRGPTGQGHAAARGLAIQWSDSRHVTWKAPVPGRGHSSPVVSGEQVWLTTATDGGKSLRAICLDRASGHSVHDVEVFKQKPSRRHPKNGFASPTPVTDGKHVWVHFGAAGTACLAADGRIVWKRTDLKYHHPHAPASSPIVFGDTLILCCDGKDAQFLVALDKKTGRTVWNQPRQHLERARVKEESEPASRRGFPFMAYSTPLVIEVAGEPQIICPVADHVAAYDPRNGREIWWHGYNGFSQVARPVFGHGLVFVIGTKVDGQPELFAIRPAPDIRGELSDKSIRWRRTIGVPHVPSPLLIGDELYLLHDRGVVTCLDARSGRLAWQRRLAGNYSASPIFADGRVYACNEVGRTSVFLPGRMFRRLAVNVLPAGIFASPAVAGRALFLRTETHVYRIETAATH